MIGFLVITVPNSFAPHTQYGMSFGQVHIPFALFIACFTALSSNEWNVITHNLPSGFNTSIEFFIVSSSGFISLFTSILIA